MLEVDRLCKQYGFDEASIRSMMASATGAAAHSSQPSPEIQETPSQVNNAPMNARPNLINKDQFRFEYDPQPRSCRTTGTGETGDSLCSLRRRSRNSRHPTNQGHMPCMHVRDDLPAMNGPFMKPTRHARSCEMVLPAYGLTPQPIRLFHSPTVPFSRVPKTLPRSQLTSRT